MSFIPHHNFRPHQSGGFTLIEVLVIAPIVILVIGAFVALMVSIVGNVLVTRDENALVYNTQDALDIIEQDVRLSAEFLTTTDPLPSPQGSNNNYTGGDAFISAANNNLLLSTAATTTHPTDAIDRRILYYANQPNPCGTYTVHNRVFLIKNIYFIKDNALWRRTYVPDYNTNTASPNGNTLCTTATAVPWQQNTCSPGYTASRCQTQDAKILENVSAMSIAYYATANSTTNIGPANAGNASTVQVSLTTTKTVAGEEINTSLSRRMSKIYKLGINEANSQWTNLPLSNNWVNYAGGYSTPQFTKTTGGVVVLKGLVKSGSTTVNSTIGTLPPGYRPVETSLVFPTLSSGPTSGTARALLSITNTGLIQFQGGNNLFFSLDGIAFIPNDGNHNLTDLTLENGWTHFLDSRRLRSGVDGMGRTHVRGQVSPGDVTANTTIAFLPGPQQPDNLHYYFSGGSPPSQAFNYYGARRDQGIRARGISTTYLAIQAMFYPKTFTGWSNLTLLNGWQNNDPATYPSAQYTKAADGLVTVRGMIKSGTTTSGTVIAKLPVGYRPKERQIFSAVLSGSNLGRIDVMANGDITTNVVNATWTTLNDIKFMAEQ